MREEKASVLTQFEQLTREKARLDEELRPFHAENEQLRVQISQFSDKRDDVKVHCRVSVPSTSI